MVLKRGALALVVALLGGVDAWKSAYNAQDCKENKNGALRCRKLTAGSCTVRRAHTELNLELVKKRCPNLTERSKPAYHTGIDCATGRVDNDIKAALANNMYQDCGNWCLYSDTIPQEKSWMWNNRGCWQEGHKCLEVKDEREYALSAKMKFCPEIETAKLLQDSGKYAGSLSLFEQLLKVNVAENDAEMAQLYAYRAVANAHLGKEAAARKDSDMAVNMDESNPLPRFMRAKARLAVGKDDAAESDVRSAIDMQGALPADHPDKQSTNPSDMQQFLKFIVQARTKFDQAMEAYSNDDFPRARSLFDQAKTHMPSSDKIRMYMADCELSGTLSVNRAEELLSEMTGVLKKDSNNLLALVARGKAYAQLGNLDMSVNHFKEALKQDPEHKSAKKEFKKLRKVQSGVKDAEQFVKAHRPQQAIEEFTKVLALSPPTNLLKDVHLKMCQAYMKLRKYAEADAACSKCIEIETNHLDCLLARGDARTENEDYDKAIRDYQTVFDDRNGRTRETQEKLNKAKRLLKMSNQKDYYKILGVEKRATDKQIKSAYRKLALEWHPDKHTGDAKEAAEAKFHDIAAAYEILSDKEKRAMVDRGEDPNEKQQGGGGGGFNPFGGGMNMNGRQFHFRFG